MLNYLLSVTPVRIVEYMLATWFGMMVCDVTNGWLFSYSIMMVCGFLFGLFQCFVNDSVDLTNKIVSDICI